MKKNAFLLFNIVAYILICYFAFLQKWSLKEFCWVIWVCGLYFSWFCAIFGTLVFIFSLNKLKAYLQERINFLEKISNFYFYILLSIIALFVGYLVFYIYSYIFSFYGLFLSVFAEMEPLNYFGKNGFINSNFYDPVIFLFKKYYLIILGTIISNFGIFIESDYKNLLFLPFKTKEILRIHLLVILLPFLSLIFYLIFKDKYQFFVILLLSLIFYFFPFNIKKQKSNI